jgi:hypothetical protein
MPISICLLLHLILNLSIVPRRTNLTDNLLGVRVGVAANVEPSMSHSAETPPKVGTPVGIYRNTSSKTVCQY